MLAHAYAVPRLMGNITKLLRVELKPCAVFWMNFKFKTTEINEGNICYSVPQRLYFCCKITPLKLVEYIYNFNLLLL